MNKIRLIVLTILAIGIVACGGGKKTSEASKTTSAPQAMEMESHDTKKMEEQMAGISENEQVIYYTCPMEMHKHVHAREAGKCPECGMKLVPAVVTAEENKEFYGCPMEAHSHIRSDEPGTCAECGMTLKPMRLAKS